jgi:hypothetical protein
VAANLELVIKGIDQASGVIKNVDDSAGRLGNTLGTGLKLAAAGAAVGVAGLGAFLVTSVKEAMESQDAIAQLEAVLKSTGGAAGLSKDQLTDMAGSFQSITAFSDEAVLGVENLLLTFTSIGAPIFEETTGLALDMSQALGQDLKSSSIQLGKALNDPITGMTALRRVGVQFTDDQEKQIKALQASGDLMGAQKLILAELSKEFGGSAAAAADTFGGRMQQLKNAFGEVQEKVGMALLPVLTSLAKFLAGNLPAAMEFVSGVIDKVKLGIDLLIGGFKEGDVTSSGWHGAMERIGKVIHDDVLPPVKAFIGFLKDFVSNKTNLIGLGGAIAGLFTIWAVTAAIAAVATIAAAAPLILLALAVMGLFAAFAVLEAKTGFFSEVLLPVLQDVAEFVGPILGDALITLKQGWDDLQPSLITVADFLNANVLPVLGTIGKFLTDHPILLAALAAAILLLIAPWLLVIATIVLVLAKWDDIKKLFTEIIPGAIDSVITKIQELPIIGAIFTDTWNTVWTIVQTYVQLVLLQVHFLFDSIINFFNFWKAIFTGDWSGAWNALKAQAEAIWNLLAGSFGVALDAVRNMALSKLAMIAQIGIDIGNAIISGFNAVAVPDVISKPFDIARDSVQWLIDRIQDLIDKINSIPSPGDFLPGLPDVNPFQHGSREIPRNMLGLLHKGEMVIPATIAQTIRGGGGLLGMAPMVGAGSGSPVYVTVNYSPAYGDATPAQAERMGEMIRDALSGKLYH